MPTKKAATKKPKKQTKAPSPKGNGGVTPPAPAPTVVDDADPKVIEAPPAADLVPAYPEDVYRALTAADERQIAQEIQGRAVTEMLYSFRQGGTQVTGLSWKGVREAVRQVNTRGFGRIAVDGSVEPRFEEVAVTEDTGKTDDQGHPITEERKAIRCTVYAKDVMHGGGNFGTATQLCEMKLTKKGKDGRPIRKPDPFAATKALSKAERNALEPFIPLELVEELKALYLDKGQVAYIPGVGQEVTQELPPPLTDQKATKQVERIRKLYEELKQAAGLKALPPARFNHYLVAAQHSHDRLDDFAKHLDELIANAKEKKDG